ncbi:uncharacterized protein si:ch1073-126c3.2 [Synchiropus splendidus]|uniref:uncharacterized protein si:ch1073-126c3.2 n=1 Tax=Synchiropus splendidus TaxID=270530 RepID=UPI00237ED8E4|nr:uncharacterized protein si:ch1073-126c3.2 [Synchiropus splendidus]
MDIRWTLLILFTLTGVSFTVSPDESGPQNCSSQLQLFNRMLADVELADACFPKPPTVWSSQQLAMMLLHMRNLNEKMHKHHLTECEMAQPKNCTALEVPENGGLACVTIAMRRFCRPLCHHGYDFAFIKGSPTYVECSEQTRFRWSTQYVGGNKVAVCHWSRLPPQTGNMYFPKSQNCLTTKQSSELTQNILEDLISEVKRQGIDGAAESACLLCG